jgi:hypothetical protein
LVPQQAIRTSAAAGFKPVVYWGMALYILLAFAALALGDQAIAALIPEDHYFENVGALSLFIASLFFFYCFVLSLKLGRQQRISIVKQAVYLGMALLFFFGAGEEISWGQRIFGVATPADLAGINTQGETNLHNLGLFQLSQFLSMNTLFDLFWFLFAVALPVLVLAFPRIRSWVRRLAPVVPWALGALFLWDYVLAKLSKVFLAASYTYARIPVQQSIQEVKESNYSILFIMAGIYAMWELKNHIQQGEASPASPASLD